MRPTPRGFSALLLVATGIFLPACSDEPGARAKHLLFISVDTLRKDRLGCYGARRSPSPNIDRLAAEGVVFLDAYTPRGMTLPSFATFFTSKYPTQHGVIHNQKRLPDEERTLAERLSDAGFRCRALNASGVLRPGHGNIEQGFSPGMYKTILDEDVLTAKAEQWIRERFGRDDKRDFLWVHFMNPHKPYAPPQRFAKRFTDPSYDGPFDGSGESLDRIYRQQIDLSERDRRHIEGLYDATIAYVDECVGRILRALEDSGQARDTLVVFASDHGEDLYSHNKYFYHANSIYSSTTALAWIVWQKDRIEPRRVRGLVENIDFMPTVLSWLGIEDRSGCFGLDLTPVLLGEDRVRRDFSVAFTGTPEGASSGFAYSARSLDWNYVWNPEGVVPGFPPAERRYEIPEEQLFFVREDPDEQRDRLGDNEQAVEALRREILAFQARYVNAAVELPDYWTLEKIDDLEQQGYISSGRASELRIALERRLRGEGEGAEGGDGG